MTGGHYCMKWFPRPLWSKKLLSIWVLFSIIMHYGCFLIVMNTCELCFTSDTMKLWTSWNRNSQWKLQLASAAVHNRVEACVLARSGIFKNLLRTQVSVKWRQFHEVKFNLFSKFIMYYACLLFCSIYLKNPYPL